MLKAKPQPQDVAPKLVAIFHHLLITVGHQGIDQYEVDTALFQIMRFCLRRIELLDNPRDEGNASRCGENGWHGVGLKQKISEVEVDTKIGEPSLGKAAIAGLHPLRLIHEATTTALAFGR
ncbi:hypothetical protein F0562_025614 [Nyssa sinensis]|uniref:Uncharacterized protein n=1 Tax=Nyssa sinensis TaxID=561372 RepID=A0A5J5BAJ5_9ASTE|nr:hypothetical protein F0562_025614 [Nyssa sinensis]